MGREQHRYVATDHLSEALDLLGRAAEELQAAELNASAGDEAAQADDIAVLRRAVEREIVIAAKALRRSRSRHRRDSDDEAI